MTAPNLPAAPGSYVLVLAASAPATIAVGRLGEMEVAPGWYLYAGSALGGGGLAGRLRHHLRPVARPHWHIDYLRQVAVLRAIWYLLDTVRWEHNLAGLLERMAAPAPCSGFGSSDCSCSTHAFYRETEPACDELAALALAASVQLPPLHCAAFPGPDSPALR